MALAFVIDPPPSLYSSCTSRTTPGDSAKKERVPGMRARQAKALLLPMRMPEPPSPHTPSLSTSTSRSGPSPVATGFSSTCASTTPCLARRRSDMKTPALRTMSHAMRTGASRLSVLTQPRPSMVIRMDQAAREQTGRGRERNGAGSEEKQDRRTGRGREGVVYRVELVRQLCRWKVSGGDQAGSHGEGRTNLEGPDDRGNGEDDDGHDDVGDELWRYPRRDNVEGVEHDDREDPAEGSERVRRRASRRKPDGARTSARSTRQRSSWPRCCSLRQT